MAARSGMSDVIAALRAETNAGTADYTVSGTTYWTDEQLETVLDRHRVDYAREPLEVVEEYSGGSAVYHDYYWRRGGAYVEQAASGTAAWRVEDSTGTVVGTANYTVNYDAMHIRFTADQQGTAYLLRYRAYDLHRAAAEVWTRKAAHVADRYDVKTDNHDLKRSQLAKQYLEMAAMHRRMAPARSVTRVREDVSG